MGKVYILNSKYYPGFVKIGATSRSGQHRADELNAASSGLAGYSVLFEREFEDYYQAETEMKRILKPFKERGEVFNVKPDYAVHVLEHLWDVGKTETLSEDNFVNLNSPKQLGELIKRTRISQGLTQATLAGVCGTGLRFIVELESGKETIQIGKTMHVMNMLGIRFGSKR